MSRLVHYPAPSIRQTGADRACGGPKNKADRGNSATEPENGLKQHPMKALTTN
jgi:hypothetical protein